MQGILLIIAAPVFCGIPSHFYFYQGTKIETLKIKAYGIAEASIYWYIDDISTVYLSNLIVNSNYRNKGIGEQLQIIREQIGKYLNANNSCLWVKKESWMHQWYKRRGYLDFKDYKQKEFVWMIKSIC